MLVYDKYEYFGYGIQFYIRASFSFLSIGFGCNVMIFGVNMCFSVHVDNKKKDTLILGEVPIQGLDDTTLTAERKYSIAFTLT